MTSRPMRRADRAMPDAAARELLEKGEYGFLATVGADGLPYGVPLSYVVLENRVYFHSAREGRKIDNLLHCRDAAFTVVGETEPVYAKNFTTWYESAMVFGTVSEVADPDEKFRSLYALAEKYLPDHLDKAERDIRASFAKTAVYRLEIETITGKAKKPRPPV
ncbi:Pyridoxamine 5'-phosphate oxidase-related FMN-binding [uncultured delta proteobacterium]|uniref:Pyridoxamine 5'-phosphate oxidase-related FMN-binding n=1 Tax=uncultured delta proteobacterium TaxID=34034 RepID=A0A212IY79_9DELT|nr:Pyridoxamine 5'-phosphate oxidase-related FMN-binding [uncultured delta proteobacterium]